MAQEPRKPDPPASEPATPDKANQGETRPVDQQVQEEASEERAEDGGYD